MTTADDPPAPPRDQGMPAPNAKPCAHRLPNGGGWCIKAPGHPPPCEGKPLYPIDSSTLQPSYAAGLPRRKP